MKLEDRLTMDGMPVVRQKTIDKVLKVLKDDFDDEYDYMAGQFYMSNFFLTNWLEYQIVNLIPEKNEEHRQDIISICILMHQMIFNEYDNIRREHRINIKKKKLESKLATTICPTTIKKITKELDDSNYLKKAELKMLTENYELYNWVDEITKCCKKEAKTAKNIAIIIYEMMNQGSKENDTRGLFLNTFQYKQVDTLISAIKESSEITRIPLGDVFQIGKALAEIQESHDITEEELEFILNSSIYELADQQLDVKIARALQRVGLHVIKYNEELGNLIEFLFSGYTDELSTEDKIILAKQSIPPQKANKYDPKYGGLGISVLAKIGFDPEEYTEKELQRLEDVLELVIYCNEESEDLSEYKILGTGCQGIVLLKEKSAWKFSTHLVHEARLIRKVMNSHAEIVKKCNQLNLSEDVKIIDNNNNNNNNNNKIYVPRSREPIPRNVISIKGYQTLGTHHFSTNLEDKQEKNSKKKKIEKLIKIEDKKISLRSYRYEMRHNDLIALELEWIDGDSLQNIIETENIYYHQDEKILGVSFDIFEGLMELRQAEIYHRDIKPANILIEEGTGRGVIIDFSIATEDPTEINEGNRAYGGNNDLISLGQTLYELYTGHNLFDEGPGFKGYSSLKTDIKTQRELTYDDHNRLNKLFEKVRRDVNGDMGEMIVYLLDDDLWKQPNTDKVYKAYIYFENNAKQLGIKI